VTIKLLAQETVPLHSLRYLATVTRLVTDPKLLNLPDGVAISLIL